MEDNMSIEKVKLYLKQWDAEGRVLEFDVSSATVELAAKALSVIPARIAKTLSFQGKEEESILIVTAGDAKVDNGKFKKQFGIKAKMLSPEAVLQSTGHGVGGVCPFAIDNPAANIYLDLSLKRFQTIFPACGSSNSAIKVTLEELEEYSKSTEWVDVCKGWEYNE